MRENSQYLVRDGYLHGVIENDSLPAFLQEERYYFLMPTSGFFYEAGGEDQLYVGNKKEEFILFSPAENVGYSAIGIWFKQADI